MTSKGTRNSKELTIHLRNIFPSSNGLRSKGFMTIVTVGAGVVFPMAAHATFHGDILLSPEGISFGDRAVATVTFCACIEMNAMAEVDPVRIDIDPLPGNRFL